MAFQWLRLAVHNVLLVIFNYASHHRHNSCIQSEKRFLLRLHSCICSLALYIENLAIINFILMWWCLPSVKSELCSQSFRLWHNQMQFVLVQKGKPAREKRNDCDDESRKFMGFLYFSLSRRNKTSRILKACLTYMNISFIYCISKFLYETKNFVMAFKVPA